MTRTKVENFEEGEKERKTTPSGIWGGGGSACCRELHPVPRGTLKGGFESPLGPERARIQFLRDRVQFSSHFLPKWAHPIFHPIFSIQFLIGRMPQNGPDAKIGLEIGLEISLWFKQKLDGILKKLDGRTKNWIGSNPIFWRRPIFRLVAFCH